MCGIAGAFGPSAQTRDLAHMLASQRHRGPDDCGSYFEAPAGLAHNRLSIIDLSAAGRQPMFNADGSRCIVFNGEIYNYLELRSELPGYPYRGSSDTEVILAAFDRWGPACLDRFIGMFAFLLWDRRARTLFAARDRFGVKPLYYHLRRDGTLLVASEIKALHAAGADIAPDARAWANYLAYGSSETGERTFWSGISQVPAGHTLEWRDGCYRIAPWYRLEDHVHPRETADAGQVKQEYMALLEDTVKLRFRSDVPVGVNLSGGLDSSLLTGLVKKIKGDDAYVKTFTFTTGDPAYDELPWVRGMIEHTHFDSEACLLSAAEVPALAVSVQRHQDEPFGGLPTLAYARLFETAREQGIKVLLDGQGMDEQWAGYDYYAAALNGQAAGIVQGSSDSPVRPKCLTPEFRSLAEPLATPTPFGDRLLDLQYRDICHTKLPRALRFNDRASMRSSTELREPFLDHRLVEFALAQPADLKIRDGSGKWLPRQIAATLTSERIRLAPKRPVQTPQREWLRGPLRAWAESCIDEGLSTWGAQWLDRGQVLSSWNAFLHGESDNSFYVWQWISLGLLASIYQREPEYQ